MQRRRPQLRGFSYIGKFQYFLTICAEGRAAVFLDPNVARSVASQVLRDATAYRFAVIAYVLMPDHTHWLVEGLSETSALRPFVKMAKQRSGYTFRQEKREPLWQSGFYDSVIREGKEVWGVIRYIVENPVRAGLVETPEAHEWWGSGTASREEILDGLQRHSSAVWSPRR
jgi:REP element-mobilizing transposase RayT